MTEPVRPGHADVVAWLQGYERVWRTPSADALARLFTDDIRYLVSPWAAPIQGLSALERFWVGDDDGAQGFTADFEVLTVEDDTAVARVHVDYAGGDRWRDLWVLRFVADGSAWRVCQFEEWPFAPRQPDGHAGAELRSNLE